MTGILRNDNVFGKILEELRHWGFHCTILQYRMKLKELKKYKKILNRSRILAKSQIQMEMHPPTSDTLLQSQGEADEQTD